MRLPKPAVCKNGSFVSDDELRDLVPASYPSPNKMKIETQLKGSRYISNFPLWVVWTLNQIMERKPHQTYSLSSFEHFISSLCAARLRHWQDSREIFEVRCSHSRSRMANYLSLNWTQKKFRRLLAMQIQERGLSLTASCCVNTACSFPCPNKRMLQATLFGAQMKISELPNFK